MKKITQAAQDEIRCKVLVRDDAEKEKLQLLKCDYSFVTNVVGDREDRRCHRGRIDGPYRASEDLYHRALEAGSSNDLCLTDAMPFMEAWL